MSKIVLITGATAGIGEACARLFAQQNYDLILTGRRTERLDALATQLVSEFGIRVNTITMDVQIKEDVAKLEMLTDEWKKVNILINNAGLSQGLDPINSGSTTDWEVMIDTNIKGLLYVTKLVSNWMIENGSGHIINIGSIAGKETYLNGNVYCATKHAVDSLNKAMRIDLLPYKIKVTAIHPGAVETEFSEVRFHGDKERAKKVYEGFDALNAHDIAETIWFVASRPPHVNINDILVMPTAQANTSHLLRE
ncbi:SDR family NAD(P)-dependent oxidoreductase [Daejeonella sp.]|jgi:3-hydroxy acid dehydrogenase/malonic semialdehyde reductase|uniref:SDR family NAD(P)-dependent oxidoreductase n=1 Tax=Daejeonella sp. TaxID=2805397 RepID=UPI003782EEC6